MSKIVKEIYSYMPFRIRKAGENISSNLLKHCVSFIIALVILFIGGSALLAADIQQVDKAGNADGLSLTLIPQSDSVLKLQIPAGRLRPLGVHNSGKWYMPIDYGRFPPGGSVRDPESGQSSINAIFPRGSNKIHLYRSLLWIGGIVGEDTLVSTVVDPATFNSGREMWPIDLTQGAVIRTGNFADDEFTAIYTDTITDVSYTGQPNQYDDTTHIPLGIEVEQTSRNWADTLYDDFVIISFNIKNILGKDIHDGWAGFFIDPDIYHSTGHFNGYGDDIAGALDTLLYDGDLSSRIVIPYCYDNDGDPLGGSNWDDYSVRGAFSLALINSSFPNPIRNFNWWFFNFSSNLDYGPRQIGTTEDPYREFAGGFSGTAYRQEDKYYIMSHPEIDYNQLHAATIDSSDGWIPHPAPEQIVFMDTRMLFSFGPFDLPPGDSIQFTIAYVVSDSFHVNPNDFVSTFDAYAPEEFENTLDFSRIIDDYRRIDSVYNSGFTLPLPGPPVGLTAVAQKDNTAKLIWNKCNRPDILGYYVYVKDTSINNIWGRSTYSPIIDTTFTYFVPDIASEYFFAVSAVDTLGRESEIAFYETLIAGIPNPPRNLSVELIDYAPELSWEPATDTTLAVYLIYRRQSLGLFVLYDSTVALSYRDNDAESGIPYEYYITACNIYNFESTPSNQVAITPMYLNQGILVLNVNSYGAAIDSYRIEYVKRLVNSVGEIIGHTYLDVGNSYVSLKTISNYSPVIINNEKGGGSIVSQNLESIAKYLSGGGKVLFLTSNASTKNFRIRTPLMVSYSEGSIFYDILRIDSALVNGLYFENGSVYGDLMGSISEITEYPDLAADSNKIANALFPAGGYLPLSGCLYPREGEVEVIYRYQSLYPDNLFHNQVNGIRYLGEDYSFVLLNFPLSLMEYRESRLVFRQALRDLGVFVDCGDASEDNKVNVSDVVNILAYLYRNGAAVEERRSDVDCSGQVDLADAVILINLIFSKGPYLNCCEN